MPSRCCRFPSTPSLHPRACNIATTSPPQTLAAFCWRDVTSARFLQIRVVRLFRLHPPALFGMPADHGQLVHPARLHRLTVTLLKLLKAHKLMVTKNLHKPWRQTTVPEHINLSDGLTLLHEGFILDHRALFFLQWDF